MSSKLSPQEKAWVTRRINIVQKALGFNGVRNVSKNVVSKSLINKFLKERPDTSEMMVTILKNLNLSDEVLSKKLKTQVGVVKRFRKYAINSVLGKQRYRGSKQKSNITCDYTSCGKMKVREAILKMLEHELSPKKGIVPTLPFEFEFERMVIRNEKLNGLYFNGYNFAYNKTKSVESRKHFKKQMEVLEKESKLSKRILMRYQDLNSVLMFGGENQYAHIFADYCGTLSTNKGAIEYVIKNNLVQKGGLFWITLNSRSTNGDKDLKNVLPKLIESVGGSNYRIEKIEGEKVYSYNGSKSGKGAPTLAIVVRRIK